MLEPRTKSAGCCRMKKFITALLLASCVSAPAFALSYPVSGRYGESSETKPGPIDCTGKRVIRFEDQQRFDSRGGVPAYRMMQLLNEGNDAFTITEEFDTAQIRARYKYRLRLIDPDRIEIAPVAGAVLKLKRCL